MGISSLQYYIETNCKEASVPVDLIQIARSYVVRRKGKNDLAGGRLCLVVDAESCLNRLYGGFFNDWVCGGQWNRMLQFLKNLSHACYNSSIELVVFFNGALENQQIQEWNKEQAEMRKNVQAVFKHVHNKATPPPKIWWVPPSCIRVCLRMALRQVGIQVAVSMDDHHQEVIGYCRENEFHGIIAQDAVYTIFDPPRYFSSHLLKLTYKGTLETKEYFVDAVAKCLDLNPNRFCLLAALLGNHILTEKELEPFFKELSEAEDVKPTAANLIPEVATFVRSLVSIDDLDAIGRIIFRNNPQNMDEKVSKFKQSVQYYLNGTQDGFLKYRPKLQGMGSKQPGSYVKASKQKQAQDKQQQGTSTELKTKPSPETTPETDIPEAPDKGAEQKEEKEEAKADSEDTKEEELLIEADSVYTQLESGYGDSSNADAAAPQIVIEPPNQNSMDQQPEDSDLIQKLLEEKMESIKLEDDKEGATGQDEPGKVNGDAPESETLVVKPDTLLSSSSSSSSGSSPQRLSPEPTKIESVKIKPNQKPSRKTVNERMPMVSHEIMRVASERHQKGQMFPWIYQALSQGEIKIAVSLEDENSRELPMVIDLYRPLRQQVYAILFNLGKLKKDRKSHQSNGAYQQEVVIKEWSHVKGQKDPKCVEVRATALDWNVPTIHRLWLGQQVEDKNRRLRAFLTCMRSDTPLMLNTSYVPQHLLIMCCVLRYMISDERCHILRRHELDAFLSQSVSLLLEDVQTMQDMKLPMLTTRGIQLGNLFMAGVESACFANDACGAPIPWAMCSPWLFFDGKLFHYKLLKVNNNTPLIDICDGQVDQVMRVERMRQAILQGLKFDSFAKIGLPMSHPYGGYSHYDPFQGTPMTYRPAGAPMMPPQGGRMGQPMGRGRGILGPSPVDTRGGRLEIAGVVVGSWGGQPRGRGTHVAGMQGQMNMNTRQMADYVHGYPAMRGIQGRNVQNMMGAPLRMQQKMHGRGKARPKKGRSGMAVPLKTKDTGAGRGRGCTVETSEGASNSVPVSEFINYKEDATNGQDSDEDQDEDDVVVEEEKYQDAEGVDSGIAISTEKGDDSNVSLGAIDLEFSKSVQAQGVMSPDSGIQETPDATAVE